MVKCGCGCGKEVSPGSKYIQGHNPRIAESPEWDYLCVVNAADANNYLPTEDAYDDSQSENRQTVNVLISPDPSPEDTLIKKESFRNLSEEAKYVIGICLNTPSELVDILLTPTFKKMSLRKLTNYFTKQWGSPRKVKRVFGEIQEHLNIS